LKRRVGPLTTSEKATEREERRMQKGGATHDIGKGDGEGGEEDAKG